ncbi:MAG: hypothetical protein EON58_13090 [Alphaproteobacteria bacterium]|nr:MAG: hypothetical protein EON58_13090 [Alphaproteobacteria bacterium]
MLLGAVLVFVGFAMQVLAWFFYRRDYPKFWVSRPVWYFLYPKGVALAIGGVWIVLAGLALYFKG